jgi:signal transduction histidine kinase
LEDSLKTAPNDTVRGYYGRKLLWVTYKDPKAFVNYYIESCAVPYNEWSLKEGFMPIYDMLDSVDGIMREFRISEKKYNNSGDLLRHIASIDGQCQFIENNDEKLKLFQKEALLIDELPDSYMKKYYVAAVELNMFMCNTRSTDRHVLIPQYKKLSEKYKRENQLLYVYSLDIGIGEIYSLLGQTDSSVFYVERAFHYLEKIGARKEMLLNCAVQLIRMTGYIGDFKKCQYYSLYCEDGLKYTKELDMLTARLCLGVSLYYSNIDLQKEKSLALMDRAKYLIENSGGLNRNKSLLLDYYVYYAEWAKTFNDYKLACAIIERANVFRDSLNSMNSMKEYGELQIKYEVAQKEKEAELEKEKSRTQTIWFIGVIVIILLSSAAIFIHSKNKSKIRNLESLIKVRNSISANLHDDVGSSLSSISIITDMVRNVLKSNPDKAEELLNKISETSSEVMGSMKDIVWSINPNNDSADNLINKMREFSANILESKKIALKFVDSTNATCDLDFSLRQDVYLIFKEAINNAAKASNATLVEVNIYKQNKKFILEVSDNGNGFAMDKIVLGNGLINMRKRAEKINGTLLVESAEGSGTKIKFIL